MGIEIMLAKCSKLGKLDTQQPPYTTQDYSNDKVSLVCVCVCVTKYTITINGPKPTSTI